MAFPFYWMLATSFKSPQEALQAEPVWVPERMKPVNWLKAARLGDSPSLGGLAPGGAWPSSSRGPRRRPRGPSCPAPRGPSLTPWPTGRGWRWSGGRGWWVRLTNTGEAGFRRVPLVVLWPKGVPLEPPCPRTPAAPRGSTGGWSG